MSTPATDYGEPWKYSTSEPAIVTAEQRVVLTGESYETDEEALRRAVACVNSCAGMADPEKEIAELYDAKYSQISLLCLMADIRAAVGDPQGKLMQDELVEHCKAMREAIAGAFECLTGLDQHLSGNHGMFLLQALAKLKPFVK